MTLNKDRILEIEAALYRTVQNSQWRCRKRDCGRKTAARCHGSSSVRGCRTSVRQLSVPTSLEISDRTTSTVTSVLRGDHRPSTFRPDNFSPSPRHRTIRRDVNWAADSMIRLIINTCTLYIPEMSRCTEHQVVTQTSERQTDRMHTHAADNPLSTQLNTVSRTVQHPPQYYAALPHAICSSAAITGLPRAALPLATAGAWKTHGCSPCLSNGSAA